MSDTVNPQGTPEVDLDNDAQTIDQVQIPSTTTFGILRRLRRSEFSLSSRTESA